MARLLRRAAGESDFRKGIGADPGFGATAVAAILNHSPRPAIEQDSRSAGPALPVGSVASCKGGHEMSTTKKTGSDGFSTAERAAMRARAQELKAQGRSGQKKADNERAVLDAIAEMPDADRVIAERIHALVTAHAPELLPRTWYGMPAYANPDGKLICFFQAAAKFDGRYAMLGF